MMYYNQNDLSYKAGAAQIISFQIIIIFFPFDRTLHGLNLIYKLVIFLSPLVGDAH